MAHDGFTPSVSFWQFDLHVIVSSCLLSPPPKLRCCPRMAPYQQNSVAHAATNLLVRSRYGWSRASNVHICTGCMAWAWAPPVYPSMLRSIDRASAQQPRPDKQPGSGNGAWRVHIDMIVQSCCSVQTAKSCRACTVLLWSLKFISWINYCMSPAKWDSNGVKVDTGFERVKRTY